MFLSLHDKSCDVMQNVVSGVTPCCVLLISGALIGFNVIRVSEG